MKKTTSKSYLTDFREVNYPRSNIMVEAIYSICQDDTGYRLEHNDKEIIPEYREELEVKIKYKFIWALNEAAVTEMTKVVKDNDPNKLNINQLYSLFEHRIIHKRNIFHSEPTSSVLYGNPTKQRKTYG